MLSLHVLYCEQENQHKNTYIEQILKTVENKKYIYDLINNDINHEVDGSSNDMHQEILKSRLPRDPNTFAHLHINRKE